MLEFHPLADLFPLMEGADFDALVADVREHGQREPIVLHEGKILDGRNRYRACQQAAVEPIVEQWDGQGTPQAFVVSHNLHRRHLNESQRAMIAARLIAAVEIYTPAHDETGRFVEGDGSTAADVADLLNVNRHTVFSAKKVLGSGTPEEIKSVENGTAAVSTLARQLRAKEPRPKKRQEPLSQAGKNPERIQNSQINAEIWSRLSDAILGLTSLPAPSDVVAIVNGNVSRRRVVDERLSRAQQWLEEFSNAWASISDR